MKPCSIIQAIVHINFSKDNDDYLDLEKIFNIFELSKDIHLKYKSEKNNMTIIKYINQ